MIIEDLLKHVISKKASDLHLADYEIPRIRIDGELIPLEYPQAAEHAVLDLISPLLTKEQLSEFDEKWEIDLSVAVPNVARFRVNLFKRSVGVRAAMRAIPSVALSLEKLDLPPVLNDLTELHNGLVLMTGPAGTGKTTTLAAIIQEINKRYNKHIITIEDPIEYSHESLSCLIDQREVKRDTKGFNQALRSALREDPDVVLVGEMRDLETIQLALTAAETGHLVFATLHTSSAAKTIDRIVDSFPAGGERSLVKNLLSESLQAVVSQKLLKKVGGGRIAAIEYMRCTQAIRSLIREDKISQIHSAIQTGASEGMHTMDQYLRVLLAKGKISVETAKMASENPDAFKS